MLAAAASAAETTAYTYDALGRLVTVAVSGGPNDGRQTSTSFDPAGNRTNYSIGGAPVANFSIADVTVTEGGTATLTVSRTGATSGAATVNYGTSNGSAAAPGDYTAASGTLSFAAGETSKTISIATISDGANEGVETFGVALSSPSAGNGISYVNAVVAIIDVPKISISGTSVVEGGAASLTVTRTGFASAAFNVSYSTVNGTAISPDDFTATTGTLSFLSGETSKTISVPTANDTVYEGPEAFTVVLSGPTGGAVIDTGTGTVSLGDNDAPPSFAVSGASATEGSNIVLTVTKSGSTQISHSVNYGTANGTAAAPGDYGASSGTLTFLPGETSKTITISTVDDGTYETAETFSLNLSGATGGATISTPTGTGTINDNDTMPSLSIANASVTEGGQATVSVTKSGLTDLNVSVAYATSNGTAGSGDYSAASGVLTFLPHEASKTFLVPTSANGKFNLAKTVNVTLSGATGATISTAGGVVTINDDDSPPSFTVGAPTAQFEGSAISFPVTLSGNLSYEPPLTVNYSTSSGTATSGVDFTGASGTLTFTSPQTVQSVSVQTTQDSAVEADETIVFTISSPSYGAAIISSQSTGTIRNDDIPPSQDPVANTDNAGTSFVRCDSFTINPIQNDTSPGGNYPLSLVSVATGSGYTRTISGNNVTFNILSGGSKTVQYVVANSAGSQATGTVTWTAASGPVCN
jgi:hypothetical protein